MKVFEPGTQLGHYRIVRKLGAGGMADVYEAEDQKLGRHVALKILPQEFGRDPKTVMRFETEVRAAALLNHRNIVTVFEVGQQDGHYFYSMRMLPGGDLRKHIEAGLKPVEAVTILRQLLEAFVEAHANNFVHRDVKPENVIFDDQGCPVLTDFGIAKILAGGGTGVTSAGVAIGTPRYMSPEQARGIAVDARTDLYSLGVMFFEMLTGQPPFDAEEPVAVIFKHVSEPVPRLPPELAVFQPLVDKLMAKDPAQRPESAEAVLQILSTLPTLPEQLPANSPLLRRKRSTTARPAVSTTTPMFQAIVPPPAAPAPPPPPAIPAPAPASAHVNVLKPPVQTESTRRPWLIAVVVLALAALAAVGARKYWVAEPPPAELVAAPARATAVVVTPAPVPGAESAAVPATTEPEQVKPAPVEAAPAMVTAAPETSAAAAPAPATPEPAVAPAVAVAQPAVKKVPKPAPPARKTAPVENANLSAARQMLTAGRSAYDNKEFKSAISYANSALLLDPNNADAKKLLDQAQRAREDAMKNIGVN